MGLLNRKTGAGASAQKAEKEITVVNRLGLHARPAALFVKVASRFRAEVWVKKESEEVNGKSIMGLMMLAAGKGSSIDVEARGPAAEEAMRAIGALIGDKFREPE
jgi:phosphocarrier protein HPr